jgi:hypothetical protein
MPNAALRRSIEAEELILAPGVYDLISALIADRMGFKALYVTGYGTVASALGLPDAGLATYSDMIERIGRIAAMAKTPVIADADTGYGGLLNVRHTARIRARGRQRHPARRPGVSQEVRPHAEPPRDRPGRHGPQDSGGERQPLQRGLPHHRAHGLPHVARPRRGAAAR